MKVNRLILPFLFSVLFTNLYSQTTLYAGDVAFISMHQAPTGADTFAIVLLTDISQGTQIGFTDGCYKDANGYHILTSNMLEWYFVWEAPTGGLKKGTIIKYYSSATGNTTHGTTGLASVGSVIRGKGLSSNGNGDQIFAFQGINSIDTTTNYRLEVTRHLAGIHMGFISITKDANWDDVASAAGLIQSELPDSLVNGVSALRLDSSSVKRQNATMTSNILSLDKTVINNRVNWTVSNTPEIPAVPLRATWNGTTWNGTTSSTMDAVINSSTSPGTFSAKSVRIDDGYELALGSATVTVYGDLLNSGNGVTGSGNLVFSKTGTASILTDTIELNGILEVTTGCTLTTNNRLTLAASSSTSYGQISPSTAGTISGNVTVQKIMSSTASGWRHYSFPVSAPSIISNAPVFFSNHTPSTERNVFYWDATDAGSGDAVGWTSPASFSASASQGYAIYHDNGNSLHTLGNTISVSGSANLGTQSSINIPNTFDAANTGNASYQGWSLIGNPYPFNLDIAVLVASGGFGTGNKSIQVWNGTNFTGLNTGIIAPFQAFWVKADGSSQTIQLSNTSGTNSSATAYMKNERNIFRLHIQDTANRFDELSIHFEAEATNDYEGKWDIPKFKSIRSDVPNFYTRANNIAVSQNALPLQSEYSVPVFIEAQEDGMTYVIHSITDGYYLNLPVMLEDKKTGIMHNLLLADYSFVHDRSFSTERFVIHFGIKNPTSLQDLNSPSSYAYMNDKRLMVNVPVLSGSSSIEVVDLMGRVWYTSNLHQGKQQIPLSENAKGLLIVRILNGNQFSSFRVFR